MKSGSVSDTSGDFCGSVSPQGVLSPNAGTGEAIPDAAALHSSGRDSGIQVEQAADGGVDIGDAVTFVGECCGFGCEFRMVFVFTGMQ